MESPCRVLLIGHHLETLQRVEELLTIAELGVEKVEHLVDGLALIDRHPVTLVLTDGSLSFAMEQLLLGYAENLGRELLVMPLMPWPEAGYWLAEVHFFIAALSYCCREATRLWPEPLVV